MNLLNIPLNQIDEDTDQPRSNYDSEALSQLVQSIKEVGLLTPIKVKEQVDGRYKIIFGHRRYKAHKILDLPSISAIISQDESEQDIFMQQLTENIQRENFSPIEEAEAFQKALDNSNWRVSIKYLANTLAKNERYISNKLSLLNFGSSIKKIIHSSTEIIPNKLTEQQVLPLKGLPVEFRDQVALKVARDEIPVDDVKKISALFSAKDISSTNKDAFLNYDKHKLIGIWDDYKAQLKQNQKLNNEKEDIFKPEIVSKNYSGCADTKIYELLPIEEKARYLMNQIPTAFQIPDDIVYSYKSMKIDDKQNFIYTTECLIDNLEQHLKQWKKIRDLMLQDGIQRIK